MRIREKAEHVDAKRAEVEALRAEVERLASKLTSMQGELGRLEISGTDDKAIARLSKLAADIASAQTVLSVLRRKEESARKELAELESAVDQDVLDALEPRENELAEEAIERLQALAEVLEALREVHADIRRAGGLPQYEYLGGKAYWDTHRLLCHVQDAWPELCGLPPKSTAREREAAGLRSEIPRLERLAAEFAKAYDRDGMRREAVEAANRAKRRLAELEKE